MSHAIQQPPFVPSMLGPVSLVTAPTEQPVTLDEVKDHCDVDLDDDDLLLGGKIAAAVSYVGHSRGWALMPATYDVGVIGWWRMPLRIPWAPLRTIDSVKYFDQTGTEQTLAASNYVVHTPQGQRGSLELISDFQAPALKRRAYPITIRFGAGYASRALVPETAKEAIYHLVDFLYENRGAAGADLPPTVEHLLDSLIPAGYA